MIFIRRKMKLYRRAVTSSSETVSGNNLIDCAHGHKLSRFIAHRILIWQATIRRTLSTLQLELQIFIGTVEY